MLFGPKGYLPLTTAVDQLAGARQPVGQTKDDAKRAARAELRVELYSGSISAVVVSRRSGKIYRIRSHFWGSELAPTWLEQGECLLTEGQPPLGYLYEEGWVTIFVSQDGFERLLAQQVTTKQDAVPPPDPMPPCKPVSEADSSEKVSPIEGATPFAGERQRGRRKGQGSFESQDRLLFPEMERLISSGDAVSPEGAARLLAEQAHGAGSLESKAERLARRFRSRAD